MAIPVLIDTDVGVDDAVALALALASEALDVRAVVGVGGSVGIDQVMTNIRRLLGALRPPHDMSIGRGLDQTAPGLSDRRDVFGSDGLGEWDHEQDAPIEESGFQSVYREAVESVPNELCILALGPLTNLAAVLREAPEVVDSIKHVYISGGAVWARGDVDDRREFNFYRDPAAAKTILSSGLSITVAPLDVASLVCLDQSHVAHMAASGYRTGESAAAILEYVMEQDSEPGYGKAFVPAAVAAGSMVWPDLFLKTRMRLGIATNGADAGRCEPALGGDKSQHVDLLTAVNAVDFLENMLESICHEAFIV